MEDGAKKAGAAGGILAAIVAVIAHGADDCGRIAARTARSADDVVITGARHGDDIARLGRGGARDLSRLGRHGDELAGAGRYGGGALAVDDAVGSAARRASLTDDGVELLVDVALEAASYAPDLAFALAEDEEEAPPVVVLAGDDAPAAPVVSVRVVALAREHVDGVERSATSLAALDHELERGPSDAVDLVVVTVTPLDAERVWGARGEPMPSVDALLARCAALRRSCVVLAARASAVPEAIALAQTAAALGPVGLLPRLEAERDRRGLRVGLHRLEPAERSGGRPRRVRSLPHP